MVLVRRYLHVVLRCVVLAGLDVLEWHVAESSCCYSLWPVRSSILQGDVHCVVLTCARCMGLLRTGLSAVCYCSPCPPAAMLCSSECHIAGSQRSRCRNVNLFSGLCAECCLDVCPVPWSRVSLLRRRVLPIVLGGSAASSRLPRGFAEVPMSDRYSVSRLMSVMLS